MPVLVVKSPALGHNQELITEVMTALDEVLSAGHVTSQGGLYEISGLEPGAELLIILAVVPTGEGRTILDQYYPIFAQGMKEKFGTPAESNEPTVGEA